MSFRSLGLGVIPTALALVAAMCGTGHAQPMLYAQHLPEGTVYIRLASALPASATVATDFAGDVVLGDSGASRISPYFVAGEAGGKAVELEVTEGGHTSTASIRPKSGTFITVVLHETGNQVSGAIVTDHPEYNQVRARLAFYNASNDCRAASLLTAGRSVFASVGPDHGEARSLNPVSATVTATCGQDKAAPLDLGKLEEGGLYSVWMMRLSGQLTAFMAHDTIAPPRG